MKERVIIGLSGGVDSSVAAYLLKKEGYDVIAVFMINWHDKTGLLKSDCPWDHDVIFAEMVAKKIGIPFHVIDLSEKYREKVVDYMFSEYEKGRTPNPDVLCNREIKFNEFFMVLDRFKADYVATGHYCIKETHHLKDKTLYSLKAGMDKGKDQSYFLCQLNQYQLSKSLFPIGHLQKSEVREIARKSGLASAEKKDSQGICFVGKVDLPEFLQQKLASKEGEIIEIPKDSLLFKKSNSENLKDLCAPWEFKPEDGFIIGKHQGAHFYTIGQRKGLNIGGKAEPLFILATDVLNNIIYVGQGQDHPGLYRRGLFIPMPDIHWVQPWSEMIIDEIRNYLVRVRYRQALQNATIFLKKEGMYIQFEEMQRGITPGQFAAWYDGEILIGSGVIQ
jgi:tRNA-uridine 2-sulfurtransferase